MTLQEFQNQALQLSIADQWRLVQSLLSSIQRETQSISPPNPSMNLSTDIDPWTQSLLGVIQLSMEDPTESYTNYLEKKYK